MRKMDACRPLRFLNTEYSRILLRVKEIREKKLLSKPTQFLMSSQAAGQLLRVVPFKGKKNLDEKAEGGITLAMEP